jgi:hypothetical protein
MTMTIARSLRDTFNPWRHSLGGAESLSESSSCLPGLNLPIGWPEISIGFGGWGLWGAAPRARDREHTKAGDVRRSIYGSKGRITRF